MAEARGGGAGPAAAYDLQGPPGAPLVVLLGSLGTTRAVWDRQVPALRPWCRVLRLEHPGHGGEAVPPGPGRVEAMGQKALALLDELEQERFSVAGLSLGGLVAMWLAAHHPHRVERLALCCTRPRFEPPGAYGERAAQVREGGTAPLVEASLGRWFSDEFLQREPDVGPAYATMLSGVRADGYAFCCEAIAAADLTDALPSVRAPTLVLSAAHDPVVPPDVSASLLAALPAATLRVLARGRHLVNVEEPGAFNDALVSHLVGDPAERGLAVRRAVLGDEHVGRALRDADELTAGFQEMLSRWPWGEIWARPGLDVTTRRLVTIGMMVALGRAEELALHVRAALDGGMSPAVLEEVLLQSAIYAGVPAANSAFAVARRVIQERGASTGEQKSR